MPELFRHAVAALTSPTPRPEIEINEIRPPTRLAPWAHAVAAEASGPSGEAATARLVLLYDPAEPPAWGGVLRLVTYLRAELDADLARDPFLPAVGWSWLTEALEVCQAAHTALGGTVTQTSSARFGDIDGPERSDDLELRASWTARGEHLEAHGAAFHALVGSAAGLPPSGVSMLGSRIRGNRQGS